MTLLRGPTHLVVVGVVVATIAAASPEVGAQRLPADYPVVDRDAGSRLRHPHGGRPGIGPLTRSRSYPSFGSRVRVNEMPGYRANGAGSRYRYRFFNHAVPSFQYYNQQPRYYRYTPETFPGLDDVRPGEIIPPAYYYPRHYRYYRYR